MIVAVAGPWWVFVLRGCVALLFAIAAVIWPRLTLAILLLLFGAYALIYGLVSILGALLARRGDPYRQVAFVEGAVSSALGLVTLIWPGVTGMALAYIIVFFALGTGAMQLVAAIQLRREIAGGWLLGLTGVISILFGLIMVAFPRTGALAILFVIAAFAFGSGVLLIAAGFALRGRLTRPPSYAGA